MLKYLLSALCALAIFAVCVHSSEKEPMIRTGLFKNNQLIGMEINKEFGREATLELTNLFLENNYQGCPNEQNFNEILETIKCIGGTYTFVHVSEVKAGNIKPSKDFLACSIDRFIIEETGKNEIISGGNTVLLIPKQQIRSPEMIKKIFSEIIKMQK
ncbi:MAG: hypothetical protein US76_02850 [Parcubacteria group bacterium GW2011_GWA2_38_13b]|nr:MAG: hypothetical protein US76_02850 [Parcubacteria group bacterium GW2011_GWA2_38_13b]